MVDNDEGMTMNYRENGKVEVQTILQTKKPATLRGRSQMDIDIPQTLDEPPEIKIFSKVLINQAQDRHRLNYTNNLQNTQGSWQLDQISKKRETKQQN